MNLVYIDDVVEELIRALNGKETREGDFALYRQYIPSLGILELIYLKNSRNELSIPDMADALLKVICHLP